MQIAAIIFTLFGTSAIIVIFVRSRARDGIRPFELTARDREEFQQMRRALRIRNLLGRLLGGFGGLFLTAGISSPFRRGVPSGEGWTVAACLTGLGLFLILCAVPLTKSYK